MPTYGHVTYQSLIDRVKSDIDEDPKTSRITPEKIQQWILVACQEICELVGIEERRELRLLSDQEDYSVEDHTLPVTGTGHIGIAGTAITGVATAGTGTISISGADIVGSGTQFTTELETGKAIIVSGEVVEIAAIADDTHATALTQPDTDIDAEAYQISATKFTQELVEGSVITIGGTTYTIDTITDAYNAIVATPATAALADQEYTIDTAVTSIPTRIDEVYKISRSEGGLQCDVKIVDMTKLIDQRTSDGYALYSNLNTPYMAAWGRMDSGRRYLKFYPAPSGEHKQCTLWAIIKTKPEAHQDDALSANAPLGTEYSTAICESVKARILEWIDKDSRKAEERFYRAIDRLRDMKPARTQIRVTYR